MVLQGLTLIAELRLDVRRDRANGRGVRTASGVGIPAPVRPTLSRFDDVSHRAQKLRDLTFGVVVAQRHADAGLQVQRVENVA